MARLCGGWYSGHMTKAKPQPDPTEPPKAYKLPPRIIRRIPFTPDIFDEYCELLAAGASMHEIADMQEGTQPHRFPSPGVFLGWLHNDGHIAMYHEARGAALDERYARAREDQQHALAEEQRHIADTDSDPQRARNRIDARRWQAAKLLPKVYGDRTQMDLTGAVTHETPALAEVALAMKALADKL